MSEIDIKRWEIVIKNNNNKSLLEKEIVKLENEIVISEIVFGDHTKNSKKSPYTSSDYSSLKLILFVDGCQ